MNEDPMQFGIDLSELDSINVTQIVTLKLGRGNGKYNGSIEELKRILETSDTPIPIYIYPLSAEDLALKKEIGMEIFNKWKKDRRRPNKWRDIKLNYNEEGQNPNKR